MALRNYATWHFATEGTVKKSDLVKAHLGEIARLRLEKKTWAEVAEALASYGLTVTVDEIRSYWGRYAGGTHPAEVYLHYYAAEAESVCRQLTQRAEKAERWVVELQANLNLAAEDVERLIVERDRAQAEGNLAEATAEIARLQARIADLEADLDAVDIMALGVGLKRRHRSRYVAGAMPRLTAKP
jgi:hypothetical protein